jgi:hypothetical protein
LSPSSSAVKRPVICPARRIRSNPSKYGFVILGRSTLGIHPQVVSSVHGCLEMQSTPHGQSPEPGDAMDLVIYVNLSDLCSPVPGLRTATPPWVSSICSCVPDPMPHILLASFKDRPASLQLEDALPSSPLFTF